MKSQHIAEEQLTEFLLGASKHSERVRTHIAECGQCRETLQAIKLLQVSLQQEDTPEPDLNANWMRLFSQVQAMPAYKMKATIQWRTWLAIATPVCVLLLLLVLYPRLHRDNQASPSHTDTALRSKDIPDVGEQLAGIEQILVLVRHTDGPLDSSARSEALNLLGNNSSYIQAATSRDEVGIARVLENSGYILTAIAHSTGSSNAQESRNTELDLDSTLLQVRILLQNRAVSNDGGRT